MTAPDRTLGFRLLTVEVAWLTVGRLDGFLAIKLLDDLTLFSLGADVCLAVAVLAVTEHVDRHDDEPCLFKPVGAFLSVHTLLPSLTDC